MEKTHHYPGPTLEHLSDTRFDAIWSVIKHWDINYGHGPEGGTGNHVRAILDALDGIKEPRYEIINDTPYCFDDHECPYLKYDIANGTKGQCLKLNKELSFYGWFIAECVDTPQPE